MKKKTLIICLGLILVVVIIGLILLIKDYRSDKETYTNITLEEYSFPINNKYKYKYLEKEEHGIFENEIFPVSYIFITDEEYSSLISKTSYFTDMGAEELDSSIEEMKFSTYDGFINSKRVLYEDTEKEYNLVIILVKLESKKTLVVQYEVAYTDNNESILKDIKNSLNQIQKIK